MVKVQCINHHKAPRHILIHTISDLTSTEYNHSQNFFLLLFSSPNYTIWIIVSLFPYYMINCKKSQKIRRKPIWIIAAYVISGRSTTTLLFASYTLQKYGSLVLFFHATEFFIFRCMSVFTPNGWLNLRHFVMNYEYWTILTTFTRLYSSSDAL